MRQTLVRRHCLILLPLLVATVAGCDRGPERFPLSGTVTYDGKPIPQGFVYFTPLAEKGNAGPEGSGSIANGGYATDPHFGSIGGPHLVRIVGYDGNADPPMWPLGQPLVKYAVEVDLPRDRATMNFDVPKQRSQAPGTPPGPRKP
jgi:hypothetical protein